MERDQEDLSSRREKGGHISMKWLELVLHEMTGLSWDQPWQALTTMETPVKALVQGPQWEGELVSFTYPSGCRPHGPNWLADVSHRKRKPRSDEAVMVKVHPVKNLTNRDQSFYVCALWGQGKQSPTSTAFIHSLSVGLKFPMSPPSYLKVPRSHPKRKYILVTRNQSSWFNKSNILHWKVNNKAGIQ